MKKKIFLFTSFVLLLFYSCLPLKKYETLNSELDDRCTELGAEQRRIENLEAVVDSLERDNRSYTNEIEEYKHSNIYLSNKIESLKQESKETAYEKTIVDREQLKEDSHLKEVVVYKTETIKQTAHEINIGKVAFYCPHEMYHEQTYDAYGLLADVLSDEVIKSLVVKNIKEHSRDTNEINVQNEDVLIKTVQFYEMIELQLDKATNEGFDIVQVHTNEKQAISDKMEKWHWKITPTTTKPQQQLLLKVIVYNENGKEDLYFTKTYHLDVKIKPFAFFQNTKTLFIENPEWAFGTIIIPFLSFLFGRYQQRRKHKEKSV